MAQRIAAGEFKVHCLRLLDEVQRSRKELIITKHGRPVARLLPADPETPLLIGRMRGSAEILGDIVAPTGEQWDAAQ